MKSVDHILIIIVILIISSPDSFSSGQLMFRHYKVEDGLSSNTIQCITQDKKGFIWIGTSDGLNRFDSFHFKVYRHIVGDSASLGNNSINTLFDDNENRIWIGTDAGVFTYDQDLEIFSPFSLKINGVNRFQVPTYSITGDKKGNLWIATIGQGLFRYNKNDDRLYQYKNNQYDNQSISSDYITKLLVDSEDRLWIATTTAGLNIYNPQKDHFTRLAVDDREGGLHEPSAFELFEDSFGNIWIGGWSKGLIRYDKEKQQFFNYLCENSKGVIHHIHSINEYSPGELMISSDDGLTFFSISSGNHVTNTFNPYDSRGLSDKFAYPIFKDEEGGIWIGTYFGGINYLPPNFNYFAFYTSSPEKKSMSGRVVGKFCEGSNGQIWIGTDDGGLNRFNPKDKSFERIYLDDKNGTPHNIHALYPDGEFLWVGTFNQGLYKLNTRTGAIKHYTKENSIRSLNGQSIYSIFKDNSGNLWIGTQRGINLYNYETDDFSRIQETGWGSDVVDIMQDNEGCVWFVSQRKGVFKYNLRTKEFSNYLSDNLNGELYIPDNRVNCLCLDNYNQLWVGTAGAGLCLLDRKRNSFIRMDAGSDIFESAIYTIISDHEDLWITTNKGLVRFNTQSKKVNSYNISDGLQSNQFNQNAGFKASTGEIYIGGVNGFNVFNPSEIKHNPYIPPVIFTNFQLFNKNVPINEHSVLRKSISSSNKIILSSKQSIFSIEFIALSYCTPLKNQYAFMLEGFDKDWINLEGYDHKITYTNLSPGKYLFKVKASNNDGIWNNTGNDLFIIITPPWWKSQLMIFAYIFIAVGLIVFLYIYLLNKATGIHDKKLKEVKMEKEKELLDAKLHFFTHIAHEIRTPVSLISAPIEKILHSEIALPDEVKEDFNIVRKNSNRLLALINQLLDLRKTEQNINQLNYKITDIKNLIEQTTGHFYLLAEQNGIRMCTSVADPVIANTDPEALTKIISNLLTNALKYAKNEINIALEKADEDFFKITVTDNGIGIHDAEKEKIFSLFYQGDVTYQGMMKGFGIGLSLVKMLADKLNGSITVDSIPGEYSRFIIRLPVGDLSTSFPDSDTNFNNDYNLVVPNCEFHENTNEESVTEIIQIKRTKQGHLLIVEDNDEFSNFIKSNFDPIFNVFIAGNGAEGLDLLHHHQIDIVISDVMMPEMDGIEMCGKMKKDVRLSHIPVILLTAKTDTNTKIEGLETGADVYIEKPFSVQHLQAQVKSLLQNRINLRERFSGAPFAPLSSVTKTKTDEELLKKINDVIEKNIANTDFSVDDIAGSLNMSRSVLYVKIKAIFDLTPNDFIRLIRLRKAAEYLAHGEFRVAEVCYLTGFGSPSYFSKCFQKQFGVLPKDFGSKEKQI